MFFVVKIWIYDNRNEFSFRRYLKSYYWISISKQIDIISEVLDLRINTLSHRKCFECDKRVLFNCFIVWIWWSSQRSFYFKLTKNRKHKCKVFVVQGRDFFSIQIMKFDLFLVSCVVNTILCLFIIIIFLWSKASSFDLLNVDRHSTKKKISNF